MADLEIKTQSVSIELLDTLSTLMQDDTLKQFYLVGGTALALQLGHRSSQDIDLFSIRKFDSASLADNLISKYDLCDVVCEENTLRGYIKGVKIELFMHPYPMIEDLITSGNLRMAGLKDIAAFKLNALANRGSKKDFWDIAYLLEVFNFEQMLGFFQTKYPAINTWHLIKSLSYFEDADTEGIEILDLHQTTWHQIKEKIIQNSKFDILRSNL